MATAAQTKISVSVLSTLFYDWSYQLEDCFIKRDAFIENLIRVELPHISADLAGKRNSAAAKDFIGRSLRRLGGAKSLPMKVRSFKVSKSVADDLREVEKEHNILRDALVNRWIVLMRARPGLLNALDLPHTVPWNSDNFIAQPLGPLPAMLELVSDPLGPMRAECHRLHGCGLYEMSMPHQLAGLSVFMEDTLVPGTTEFRDLWEGPENRLDALDLAAQFTDSLAPTKQAHRQE